MLARIAGLGMLLVTACAAMLVMAACSSPSQVKTTGSAETTATKGSHMSGPAAEVHIAEAAMLAVPKAPVLTTPEAAVRSYLDWVSYSFRVGQSKFTTSTIGPKWQVQIDSYVQYNIEKQRLLDQKLTSIEFGTPIVSTTSTVLPAKEKWVYSYLSIDKGNKVVGGPYTASYDTTYTVVKNKKGAWMVDGVKATAQGKVK